MVRLQHYGGGLVCLALIWTGAAGVARCPTANGPAPRRPAVTAAPHVPPGETIASRTAWNCDQLFPWSTSESGVAPDGGWTPLGRSVSVPMWCAETEVKADGKSATMVAWGPRTVPAVILSDSPAQAVAVGCALSVFGVPVRSLDPQLSGQWVSHSGLTVEGFLEALRQERLVTTAYANGGDAPPIEAPTVHRFVQTDRTISARDVMANPGWFQRNRCVRCRYAAGFRRFQRPILADVYDAHGFVGRRQPLVVLPACAGLNGVWQVTVSRN